MAHVFHFAYNKLLIQSNDNTSDSNGDSFRCRQTLRNLYLDILYFIRVSSIASRYCSTTLIGRPVYTSSSCSQYLLQYANFKTYPMLIGNSRSYVFSIPSPSLVISLCKCNENLMYKLATQASFTIVLSQICSFKPW